MIAIIDYDMGNIRSVEKALKHVGGDPVVTRDPKKILDASAVVLPGVGAFKECMRNLENYGLIEPLLKSISTGKPFLGICLGLQLLFEEGEEDGPCKGLGVIKGKVLKFPSGMKDEGRELKIPHMGWNSVKKEKESGLLKDIEDGTFFYFVHSYYAVPDDKTVTLTKTSYGTDFTSSIEKDNVVACQFHPEKSQKAGLTLLKNFIEMR
ncbi:MAG: imidazole glycerol phosphate synthase subunit HisH [Thermodesulfobacteriota bacterium]